MWQLYVEWNCITTDRLLRHRRCCLHIMTCNDCLADSSYMNPALANYECDGQMSIFDFINELPNQRSINKNENTINTSCDKRGNFL